MFELSQLRCFVAAAEELHFGRAASRLNMTQPPLSRQIQILERILNVTLFDRDSRNVTLTPAGRAFFPEAKRIMVISDHAAQIAREVYKGELGRLALGFTAASGFHAVPNLIKKLARHAPNIKLELRELVTGDQLEALRSGTLDTGLVRPQYNFAEFEHIAIAKENLVCALPENDPRAKLPQLCIDDFDGAPLIMFSQTGASYFRNILLEIFNENNISPNITQSVTQIHTMLGLVSAELGVAFVPESAAVLGLPGVVFRNIDHFIKRQVELHLIWKSENNNPAIKTLLEAIK